MSDNFFKADLVNYNSARSAGLTIEVISRNGCTSLSDGNSVSTIAEKISAGLVTDQIYVSERKSGIDDINVLMSFWSLQNRLPVCIADYYFLEVAPDHKELVSLNGGALRRQKGMEIINPNQLTLLRIRADQIIRSIFNLLDSAGLDFVLPRGISDLEQLIAAGVETLITPAIVPEIFGRKEGGNKFIGKLSDTIRL